MFSLFFVSGRFFFLISLKVCTVIEVMNPIIFHYGSREIIQNLFFKLIIMASLVNLLTVKWHLAMKWHLPLQHSPFEDVFVLSSMEMVLAKTNCYISVSGTCSAR